MAGCRAVLILGILGLGIASCRKRDRDPAQTAATSAASIPAPSPTFSFAGTWLFKHGAWVITQKEPTKATVVVRIPGWNSISSKAVIEGTTLRTLEGEPHSSMKLELLQNGSMLWVMSSNADDWTARRIGPDHGQGLPALMEAFDKHGPSLAGFFPALTSFGPDAAETIPQLVEALHTENPVEAFELARVIQVLGPAPASVLYRLTCGLQANHAVIRAAAADALGAMGVAAVPIISQLIAALDDEDARVRFSAASALSRMGEPAERALMAAIEGDAPRAMAGAVDALHRMGPRGEERLRQIAATSRGAAAREEALRFLDPAHGKDAAAPKDAGFWPQWRGPQRDNISSDTGLLKEWPEGGPPLSWEIRGIGLGTGAPCVRDGRVYVVGAIGLWEWVHCIDEKTGQFLWRTVIGRSVREWGHMRWLGQRAPTVDRDLLYVFHLDGKLICLRTADGKEIWRKDYVREFGASLTGTFGFLTDFPLVDGDRLICNPCTPSVTLCALNKRSGEVVWKTSLQDVPTDSCAPILLVSFRGVRQGIFTQSRMVMGFDPLDGGRLWSVPERGGQPIARSTPIIQGDSLLVSPGYADPFVVLDFSKGWGAIQVDNVRLKRVRPGWLQDSALAIDDLLFMPRDRNDITAIRSSTGVIAWSERLTEQGSGFPAFTFAEGCLYAFCSTGDVVLVEAAMGAYRPRSRFKLSDQKDSTTVPNPVLTGGRLYLRHNEDALLCYDVRDRRDFPPAPRPSPTLLPKPPGADALPPAVYMPTPGDIVTRMLDLAGVSSKDSLVDLGSGDGRIVVEAARRHGIPAAGYEVDRTLVEKSRETIRNAGLATQARIYQQDLFTADLSSFSIVTAYLPPEFLERLVPRLRKLKPGSRIVCHEFAIPGIPPDETIKMTSAEDGREHEVFLWKVPLKDAKEEKKPR